MEQVKVYLQYPWKFPDSPYYKALISDPPENVVYENTENQKGVITNSRFFWVSNFLKRNIRRFMTAFKLTIPNAHSSPKGDYDLIHCAHCLSKNKNKPWVADFESVWQFYIGEKTEGAKKKVSKILQRENCKKIIAWTEESKEKIIEEFPETYNKIEVVYPAIPKKKLNKKEKRKEFNIIFSGRYFYNKGGLHALEAIDRLTKKFKNVHGIINSEVPEEVINKYKDNSKIKFYGLIPQEELFKLYEKSDLMIYPGYSDSFGFAFLEAMSFGIPVVTVDGRARKEIIKEGETGFVISKPELTWSELNRLARSNSTGIIKEIIEISSKLIKNSRLRNNMSKNCIQIIKKGKFSIDNRNRKLKDIYKIAVNGKNRGSK